MQEQMGSCQHKNLEEDRRSRTDCSCADRWGGNHESSEGCAGGKRADLLKTACMAVYGFLSAAALPMPASWTKVSPTVKLPC